MSDRLAASTRVIAQYRIALEDAYTVLAQASLGVLLRDDSVTDPLIRPSCFVISTR